MEEVLELLGLAHGQPLEVEEHENFDLEMETEYGELMPLDFE